MNVIAVIGFLIAALGIYSLIAGGSKDGIWYGFSVLVLVFAVNYIFLGKQTVWNEVE
jgi:hypothetical protein